MGIASRRIADADSRKRGWAAKRRWLVPETPLRKTLFHGHGHTRCTCG